MLRPKPLSVVVVRPAPKPAPTDDEVFALKNKLRAERATWEEERERFERAVRRLEDKVERLTAALEKAENRADTLVMAPNAGANYVLPGLSRARAEMEEEVKRAQREAAAARTCLEASMERRQDAMQVLAVLVRTEDNGTLPDDVYDSRMETVLRRARTLLSLDALAREKEREVLADSPPVGCNYYNPPAGAMEKP